MPEPKTLEEAAEILIREQLDIFYQRQRKYGSANIARGGPLGVLMRMRDKLERLWTLSGMGALCECSDAWGFANRVAAKEIIPPPEDRAESEDDSDLDLANYALIRRLLRRGWWGLPMGIMPICSADDTRGEGAVAPQGSCGQ